MTRPRFWPVLATVLLAPIVAKAGDSRHVYNVLDYGAVGDGLALDSPAIQRAVSAAEEAGKSSRVIVPGGHRYRIGTIELRSGIEFQLQGDAELVVSTNRQDYRGDGVIVANGVKNLRITGTGRINGRARDFMLRYDPAGEWWVPAEWRPKMFILTACTNLEIRDITFGSAPQWGLHMLGCRNVLVDHLTISNLLDVPNCDGIDPDHCQNVEIRSCHIVCGDDAVVIKATRQAMPYGPSARIAVKNCVIETQDSGLKIGTETTEDIHEIRFEQCEILTASRGLTIQLRDEGSVYNVLFQNISFVSRYYADPWWGRGEAISLTAIPRTQTNKIGTIHNIRFRNITGRSENSARINGSSASRISHIRLENVNLTFDRWTAYPGGLFDNRPTTAGTAIERHGNPGFSIRFADDVPLRDCVVNWGKNVPDYFTYALEAENVTGLRLAGFRGQAAHPARDQAVSIK